MSHTSPTSRLRAVRRTLAGVASMAIAAALVVAASQTSTAAVTPTADWRLQSTRASSIPGAPTLTDIGTGNSFVSTTVDGSNWKVLDFPKGNGLKATPISALTNGSVYSIVLLYKPVTVAGYQRLLDFNGGVGDTGLYELSGNLSAYPIADGGGGALISTTAYSQIVLTRTSTKLVTAYINGTRVLQFTDVGDAYRISTTSIRFFKDNTSGGATGEEGAGKVARLRTFNTALSASQVASLDRLPTDGTDLAITILDTPDPVQHGNLLAYTLTVTDDGPGNATGVKTVLTLPSSVTFIGASPSIGTCAAPVSGKVTCTLGAVALGARATVLVVVRAPSVAGSLTATAVVSSTTTDPTSVNNTATAITTVK